MLNDNGCLIISFNCSKTLVFPPLISPTFGLEIVGRTSIIPIGYLTSVLNFLFLLHIIKGVFQKKEDTYRDKYVTVSKRPDTFRDANEFSNALEYSKERLEIMLNYLEENARKSNRY